MDDQHLEAGDEAGSAAETPTDQDRTRPIPARGRGKGADAPLPNEANARRAPAARPPDDAPEAPRVEVPPADVRSEGGATLRFTARRAEWVARAVGLGSSGRPPG